MWQFAEAVRGLADGCAELGIPVTGGNVSFYNQTGAAAIHPTPVVGVLGVIANVGSPRPDGLRQRRRRASCCSARPARSCPAPSGPGSIHEHLGGQPPRVDLAGERIARRRARRGRRARAPLRRARPVRRRPGPGAGRGVPALRLGATIALPGGRRPVRRAVLRVRRPARWSSVPRGHEKAFRRCAPSTACRTPRSARSTAAAARSNSRPVQHPARRGARGVHGDPAGTCSARVGVPVRKTRRLRRGIRPPRTAPSRIPLRTTSTVPMPPPRRSTRCRGRGGARRAGQDGARSAGGRRRRGSGDSGRRAGGRRPPADAAVAPPSQAAPAASGTTETPKSLGTDTDASAIAGGFRHPGPSTEAEAEVATEADVATGAACRKRLR